MRLSKSEYWKQKDYVHCIKRRERYVTYWRPMLMLMSLLFMKNIGIDRMYYTASTVKALK